MHRLLIIAIFLSLAISRQGLAESQRPTPSPTILSQAKQDQTKPQKAEPDNHQRGSEDSPLIVSIAGTVPTKTEISKIAEDGNTESASPWATWLLVLFNGFLAVFTFGLYRSTKKLWHVTNDQMKITRESLSLAREEFIATHRPRLILRSVAMKGPTDDLVPIEEGKPIMIRWTIVNTGDSPAQIIDSGVTAFVGSKTFDDRDLRGRTLELLDKDKIKPGGRTARTYTLTVEDIKFDNLGSLYSRIFAGHSAIYFWGFVEYSDLNGTERRTGFCRRYDARAERFTLVADPDHEYAD